MNSNSDDRENENTQNTQTENPQLEQSATLIDFSDMFKNTMKTKPKLQQQQQQIDPKHVQNVVPRNLTITQELMKQKRCLDLRRWYCLSRAQYQRSCGISSVVTVWNYLFSTLGTGQLNPISQEEAIVMLGMSPEFGPHFNDVEFGSVSGNMALMKWFKNLCRLFKVQGRAYFLWKNEGDFNTPGVDRELAFEKLKQGLQGEKLGYIYHGYDHYFCPIGYEITSNNQIDAYSVDFDMNNAVPWIIIAEPAKPHPFFTVRKWSDISIDIEMKCPQYMNIRKMEEGIKEFKHANGVSQHCIMAFEKIDPTLAIKKNKPITTNKHQEQPILNGNPGIQEQPEPMPMQQTLPDCPHEIVDSHQNNQE